MANYPLQTAFRLSLQKDGLAAVTIHNYDQAISQLFTFLTDQHGGPIKVDAVTSNDLRQYINQMRAETRLNDRTYNKVLSQLNRYFNFCFSAGVSHHLPTIDLHGQAQPKKAAISTIWLNKLPIILADEQVHPYTRLTLLLCAHGYTSQEFLQAGFFREFKRLQFKKSFEQQFLTVFRDFIQPLQALQGCPDIFLKQRYSSANPRLSAPALHKYLQHDRTYLGFSINPSDLHRSYILHNLQNHPDWNDQQLMQRLRLDPASLLYYRRLLLTK